ncbi:MAG: hypothetical protein MUC49_22030 [Raineya sp.]|jgi:hypothetical protein|nr:hypothetical protein [Raineya sp.]
MKKKFILDELIESTTELVPEIKVTINEELKALIPPLSEEEFGQLEQNILQEGCRDALILWKQSGDSVLIDGHNRYAICQRHGLSFKTEIKEFKDFEEVKSWMITNQLGKRNLTEEQKSYLRGLQYQRTKKSLGGYDFVKSVGQNVQPTHELLAQEHKVSPKTIQRDEKYAVGLDILTNYDLSLRNEILTRKIKVPVGLIQKIASISETKQIAQVQNFIKKGAVKDIENILKKPIENPSKSSKDFLSNFIQEKTNFDVLISYKMQQNVFYVLVATGEEKSCYSCKLEDIWEMPIKKSILYTLENGKLYKKWEEIF